MTAAQVTRLAEITQAVYATNDRATLRQLFAEARMIFGPDGGWIEWCRNRAGRSPRAVQRLIKKRATPSSTVASASSPVALASAEGSPTVASDDVADERGDAWEPPTPEADDVDDAPPSLPEDDTVAVIRGQILRLDEGQLTELLTWIERKWPQQPVAPWPSPAVLAAHAMLQACEKGNTITAARWLRDGAPEAVLGQALYGINRAVAALSVGERRSLLTLIDHGAVPSHGAENAHLQRATIKRP